jgi:hypothetical protein
MKFKQIRYYYLFVLAVIVGCGDGEIDNFGAHRQDLKDQSYLGMLKNYKKKNANYDRGVLLDYQLGWSKEEVENHTDSLLNYLFGLMGGRKFN